MKRFVGGEDRRRGVLFPEFLDDCVAEDNLVRVIDVFVDGLDWRALGFEGAVPEATAWHAYRPATLLKISLYGYINRVQSNTRLDQHLRRQPANVRDRNLTTCVSRQVVPVAQHITRSSSHDLGRLATCSRS